MEPSEIEDSGRSICTLGLAKVELNMKKISSCRTQSMRGLISRIEALRFFRWNIIDTSPELLHPAGYRFFNFIFLPRHNSGRFPAEPLVEVSDDIAHPTSQAIHPAFEYL